MGIFDTTANTQANAFNDPMNPVNLNKGGWGMDPNYLTPAFSAPYRPPYSGADSHIGNQQPGFFQSAFGAAGMGPRPPYGVGDDRMNDAYFDALSGKTADFGASLTQRVGLPIASFAAATALSKAWQVRTTNTAQQATMYKWAEVTGRTPATAHAYAARQSIFTAIGERAGTGLGMGMAGGMGMNTAGFAGMAARGLGTGLGFASGIALPVMAADGLMRLGNNMVYDQYTGMRENQNNLRNQFRNVTFDGNEGSPLVGRGMNRQSSARAATGLGKMGAEDQVFNSREIATMTNMAGQMGMLDNVGPNQIVDRMRSIMKQMKIVMSVAQTTDFKEAMQMMGRLTSAGASNHSVSSVMAGIGSLASVAGISTGRMMNTVGNQAQYLFQANGLTPVLGQTAAATSMGGLSAAYRSGLISNDLLARLGGMEGATQLSVTGQMNAAQSTYNQMKAFNRYTLGKGQDGVINNVIAYGQAAARNPLETMGASILDRTMNLSSQMNDDGQMKTTHDQIMDIARVMPGATKNGKITANAAAAIMSKMGMNEQEIQAYLTQYAGAVDPKSRRQFMAGMDSQDRMTTIDYLNRTGQDAWSSMPGVGQVASAYRGTKSSIAGAMGGGLQIAGGISDALSSGFMKLSYGGFGEGGDGNLLGRKANDNSHIGGQERFNLNGMTRFRNGIGNPYSKDTVDSLKSIQTANMSGDEDAKVMSSSKASKDERKTALLNLVRKGILSKDAIQNSDKIVDAAHTIPKISSPEETASTMEEFRTNMHAALLGQDVFREHANMGDVAEADQASQGILRLGMEGLASGKDKKLKGYIETLKRTTNLKSDNALDVWKTSLAVGKIAQDNKLSTTDLMDGKTSKELLELARTNPDKVFAPGSKWKEKFDAANTDDERIDAAISGNAERKNSEVIAPGTKGGRNVDPEERAHFGAAKEYTDKIRNRVNEFAKNGQIDIGQFTFASAALDMKDAVDRFGVFVDQFGKQIRPEDSKGNISGNSWSDIFSKTFRGSHK